MTQILGLLTPTHVFLVADRRVTFISDGSVKDDNRCKLVSLCHRAGIGYSGLAELEGLPTHEWICHKLADVQAAMPWQAVSTLREAAERAFAVLRGPVYPQIFLLAGYDFFRGHDEALPHFAVVSNFHDDSGQQLGAPTNTFTTHLAVLHVSPQTKFRTYTVGVLLSNDRRQALHRNIARLVDRLIGPQEMLRLLVDEIVRTAKLPSRTVGEKVLAMCIPRASIESGAGPRMMLATKPGADIPTFAYFDPTYSVMRQFGPAFVCNGAAHTDVETEDDPSRSYQSSQLRILRMPGGKEENI
jgi:hypothetical protein